MRVKFGKKGIALAVIAMMAVTAYATELINISRAGIGIAVASKSETYDIYSTYATSTKIGELTITVRKYVGVSIEGVSSATYYELDDDIQFKVTNNSYKSSPAPMGDEDIPIAYSQDKAFKTSDRFHTNYLGRPKWDSSVNLIDKWFLCWTIKDSPTETDMDDWWDNPSNVDFHWHVTYFNENSNHINPNSTRTEWFEGTSS